MSNRVFIIVLIVVAITVGLAVLFHTPGDQSVMRAVHGG